MIARLLPPSGLNIYPGIAKPGRQRGTDQQMVHSQARTLVVAAAIGVIPISIDPLFGMDAPDCIYPAVLKHLGIGLTTLGKVNRIANPSSRHHGINRSWNDIVVSTQHGRRSRCKQILAVANQALEPAQLVVELGTGCGVSVWQVKTADNEPANVRLDIAAMAVVRVAGKPASALDGVCSAS
ncbi:hypothetical protein ASD99_21745 [Mesorhizobium sp. Root695]|nr:hypothetical protein ASD99_21745 [Mesorhizobium sp. Root695]